MITLHLVKIPWLGPFLVVIQLCRIYVHHLVYTVPRAFASSVIYPDLFHIIISYCFTFNWFNWSSRGAICPPPLPSFVSSNLQPLHTKRNSKSMFLSLLNQTMLYFFICLAGFDMPIRSWIFHCRCVLFLKLKILGGSWI